MRLWDFSLAVYALPAVSEACLELQDEHGQCVGLLLWRAWTAAEGRPLDSTALAAAIDLARGWEEAVTRPLRAVRRRLKSPPPGMDGAAASALRDRVSAVELAAERLLLEALESTSPTPAGGASSNRLEDLTTLAQTWASSTASAAIQRLAQALDNACRSVGL